jgi:fructokinase
MKTDSIIINCDTAAIGIDLGGTKTEAILLASKGHVLWRQRRPTNRPYGYDAILAIVAEMINEAAAQLRNDADCFTRAGCHSGAGRGFGLVFGVIMGTGCGGGICINGEAREGPHRIAGEWGHQSMVPDGAECYCGNRGCVETLISGSGVENAFFNEYGKRLTMDEIVTQARADEERCKNTFDHFLDNFGRCLGGLISLLDPDAIVLGGGLSNIDELYSEGIEKVKKYAFHDKLRTPILKNQFGDSAGVFGAAWIGKTVTG